GHEATTTHEAEAILDDIQDACCELLSASLHLALEDPLDKGVLAHVIGTCDLKVAADLHQLADVLVLQLIDVHGHQDGPRWVRVDHGMCDYGCGGTAELADAPGIWGSRAGMSC